MSHLSSIGFRVKTQEAVKGLARRAMAEGDPIPGGAGYFYRWRLEAGSELWVHTDEDGAVLGIEPHFDGPAQMQVVLGERVVRSPSGLDGGFAGALRPAHGGGATAFLFDVPDFARHRRLALPAPAWVQLAAFAHTLEAFADPGAFLAAQRGEKVAFTPETLIPVSLFAEDRARIPPPEFAELFGDRAEEAAPPLPEAVALLSGVVLETETRLNEAGGAPFRYVRIRTAGGEVNVVADPRIVRGEIVTGGVVYGDCWLSGRIVED